MYYFALKYEFLYAHGGYHLVLQRNFDVDEDAGESCRKAHTSYVCPGPTLLRGSAESRIFGSHTADSRLPKHPLSCRGILTLMKTPENIIDNSYAYIWVIFLGIPVTFLYNMTSGIIRALGENCWKRKPNRSGMEKPKISFMGEPFVISLVMCKNLY